MNHADMEQYLDWVVVVEYNWNIIWVLGKHGMIDRPKKMSDDKEEKWYENKANKIVYAQQCITHRLGLIGEI